MTVSRARPVILIGFLMIACLLLAYFVFGDWRNRAGAEAGLVQAPADSASQAGNTGTREPQGFDASPNHANETVQHDRFARAQSFATSSADIPLVGDALSLYQELEARARSGDARAAFALYELLEVCEAYDDVGKFEGMKSAHRANVGGCEQLMESGVPRSVDALRMAAQMGHVKAKVAYPAVAGLEFMTAESIARDVPGFEQYQRDAVRFLHEAAEQGSVEAMLSLSDVYREGLVIDSDPVRALAYREAALRSGLLSYEGDQTPYWVEQMSVDERRQAEELAIAILNRCCS